MAAPVPTSRGTPSGIMLDDGFSTKITLALAPTIEFKEKTVKPPGIDGGDPIVTTTMHNTAWRTKAPKHLVEMTDTTTTVAYDPLCYTDCLAACNRKDTITVTFPDGSTLAYYGYLKMFDPQEVSEGEQPEAQITIIATNFDHVNKVEAAPVLTNVAGT